MPLPHTITSTEQSLIQKPEMKEAETAQSTLGPEGEAPAEAFPGG